MKETSSAEQTKEEVDAGTAQDPVRAFREGERAKMARTLERLLRVARGQARRRAVPSLIRLKWVNTVCYLTQTYNSILGDTEYDAMRQEMALLQEKVEKLTKERYRRAQTDNTRDQLETGQPDRDSDA